MDIDMLPKTAAFVVLLLCCSFGALVCGQPAPAQAPPPQPVPATVIYIDPGVQLRVHGTGPVEIYIVQPTGAAPRSVEDNKLDAIRKLVPKDDKPK